MFPPEKLPPNVINPGDRWRQNAENPARDAAMSELKLRGREIDGWDEVITEMAVVYEAGLRRVHSLDSKLFPLMPAMLGVEPVPNFSDTPYDLESVRYFATTLLSVLEIASRFKEMAPLTTILDSYLEALTLFLTELPEIQREWEHNSSTPLAERQSYLDQQQLLKLLQAQHQALARVSDLSLKTKPRLRRFRRFTQYDNHNQDLEAVIKELQRRTGLLLTDEQRQSLAHFEYLDSPTMPAWSRRFFVYQILHWIRNELKSSLLLTF